MFKSIAQKLFGLLFFVILFVIQFSFISTLSGQTLKNLKTPKFPKKYELKDTSDVINITSLNETIRHHQEMIAKYPNEPFISHVMFELAELTASKSHYEFKKTMNQYEADLEGY